LPFQNGRASIVRREDDEMKRRMREIVKLINLDGHDDASRLVSGFMGILHFGKVLARQHRQYEQQRFLVSNVN
jgi:hypothetical protein